MLQKNLDGFEKNPASAALEPAPLELAAAWDRYDQELQTILARARLVKTRIDPSKTLAEFDVYQKKFFDDLNAFLQKEQDEKRLDPDDGKAFQAAFNDYMSKNWNPPKPQVGLYQSPALVHRLATGMKKSNQYVTFRTVATVMHAPYLKKQENGLELDQGSFAPSVYPPSTLPPVGSLTLDVGE